MSKKRGCKGTYKTYGGSEVKDVVKGLELGLSFNQSKKSYYMMIPKALLPDGTKRSKQVWLKSDLQNAVLKFRAIVKELKGEKENKVTILEKINDISTFGDVARLKIDERKCIEWLKKELENPSELAKKTGIDAFNHFYDWMLEVPIKLDTLIDNFFSLRKKPISAKEEKKTRATWKMFCEIIGKKKIQEVSLADIQKYEDYIHSQNYAPKTIAHYLNRITKVFNYNCGKFEDNGRIIKISKWCLEMEKLEDNNSEAPEVIDLETFEKLYNNTHILLKDGKRNSPNIDLAMKAMLTYALNTASTVIDLSRLTKDEIDLKARTLSTRRRKKGQVKKVAYLWDRTAKDLKEYLDSRKDKSPYVFLSRTGAAYTDSGLRKLFKRYKKAVNDKLKKEHPDDKDLKQIMVEFKHLRDTFSTIAKDLDIDPFKINCVMGHSNKGMVDKYSKRQISNNLKEACLEVERDFFEL